jgi:hypothetical protein
VSVPDSNIKRVMKAERGLLIKQFPSLKSF